MPRRILGDFIQVGAVTKMLKAEILQYFSDSSSSLTLLSTYFHKEAEGKVSDAFLPGPQSSFLDIA